MNSPRFSVIVPTKERADTLRSCLATCINQDFDDFELIVCDNHSSPATKEVVDALASPNVRYLRTDRPLAMSANWEYAMSEARGEYVIVIGDDDGLMPYALRELDKLIVELDRPTAICWTRVIYTWPTIAAADDANYLMVPVLRQLEWLEGRRIIQEVVDFKRAAHDLPMLYHAAVRRDLIDRHRDVVGRVFPTMYPDMYTAFAFGWLAEKYPLVSVPMSVVGLSGNSNGMAMLQVPEGGRIATDFNDLNAEFDYLPHPRVPDLPIMPVHIVDSFEYAKQYFFPDDDTLDYDRLATTTRYLESIQVTDPASRIRYRGVIRDALADRPDLQDWFDREAPEPPPCAWFRWKPRRFGFDGICLHVDTAPLDVADVEGAIAFATRLLDYANGAEIRYDLPGAYLFAARLREAELLNARSQARLRATVAQREELRRKYRALRAASPTGKGSPGARLRRLPRRVGGLVKRRIRAQS